MTMVGKRADGSDSFVQTDQEGNLSVTPPGMDLTNDVMKVETQAKAQYLAATGVIQGPVRLLGVVISDTSTGTIAFHNHSTSTNVVINTITLPVGVYRFPAIEFNVALRVVITGTVLATILYAD